jgi:hypothetical protein
VQHPTLQSLTFNKGTAMNKQTITISIEQQHSMQRGIHNFYKATYTARSGRKISAIGLSEASAIRNLNRKSPIAQG